MTDLETAAQAKIFYYARERYYRSMKVAVNEALHRFSNDPLLKFLSAYCSILQGALSEGINELEYLKEKRDMNLACYWGLMTAYKLCATFDKDAYAQLDVKLKEERKTAGDRSLYHAGLFLFLIGKPERAKEYVERSIKINQNARDVLSLRGWVELHTAPAGNVEQAKRALEYFDRAMSDGRNADALLGKAACCTFLGNYSAALECCNQLIVSFPKFNPAVVEKMKIQLYMQDWDAMAETAVRCLTEEPQCIEALKYMIIKLLAFHGGYQEAAEKIAELNDLISVVEPSNGVLCSELAQLFARMCGRDADVLSQTIKLAELAVKVSTNKADAYAELGFQYMLKGRLREAANCFDQAIKTDGQCSDATIGLIRCQILQNRFSEADHQLQFIKELSRDSLTAYQHGQVYFLTALLTRKKLGEVASFDGPALEMLNKASEMQARAIQDFPLGPQCFMALDTDLMLEIVKEYLFYAPDQPIQPGQPPNPVLKRCEEMLRTVTKAAPGLLEASFLLAKVKFLLGDAAGAQATLQHCLDLNPNSTEAHILMSQILYERGSYQLAEESLQQGLSFNFEIKDNPSYQLLRSRILRRRGQNEEVLQLLQSVVKSKSFATSPANDKASVYLELISSYLAVGQQGEAARVVEEGQQALKGSPAALMRLQLADADLALARGDVETTLAKLRSVESDSPLFVDSRQKLAQIYLKHRRDQRLYISCYKEICDKQQHSIPSLLMLGDAYMEILEAEKAIEVYESAAKKNPRDFQLAQKIGQTHVKTHNYSKAVNYYEASLKAGGQRALYVDLLKLFIRLRHYEKAEKIIKQLLAQSSGTDLQSITEDLNFHWLYAQVLLKTNHPDEAIEFLEKGKELQSRVLKRMSIEQPDALPAQREQAVELCRTLADCYVAKSDLDSAFKALKDALQMSEGEPKSMLTMARLCLLRQDLDRCQQLCSSLLKDDREVEEATLLMGEVLCQRDDDQGATELFQTFVRKNPTSFTALSRLIDLLRRAGRLSAIPAYFEMLDGGRPSSGSNVGTASNSTSRLALEPGYLYCQGLYEWYSCNTTAALKLLNRARRDATWGLKASYLMVEISLNPDRLVLGSELFGANVRSQVEESHNQENADADAAESEQMALRTAEKLLEDVKPRLGDRKRDIFRSWLLICRKSDAGLNRAIQDLNEMLKNHGKSVSILYALSVACCLRNDQNTAKRYLKELAQWQWSFEDSEELERSWLLLADIYIAAGNADTGMKLLEQCINHNKSCWRAYEYMGFLAEREKNYEEATARFEQAWMYCNKNNPNVGFKYAFNCLRERQNVEAIETCLHILKNYPTYPRIRKEILEKARTSVRV